MRASTTITPRKIPRILRYGRANFTILRMVPGGSFFLVTDRSFMSDPMPGAWPMTRPGPMSSPIPCQVVVSRLPDGGRALALWAAARPAERREQAHKLGSLSRRQRAEHRFGGPPPRVREPVEHERTFVGERDEDRTAIVRIYRPHDEPGRLETV